MGALAHPPSSRFVWILPRCGVLFRHDRRGGMEVNVIETIEKVIDVPVVKQIEVPQAPNDGVASLFAGAGIGCDPFTPILVQSERK